MLCELADVVGRVLLASLFLPEEILARVYTIPLTKPRKMALTLATVTGASKKIKPLMAMGSLLREPTML